MTQSCVVQLRLLPALSLAAVAGATSPAAAQDLTRCLAIKDVPERVRCYDEIARAQQASAPATAAVPAAAPVVRAASTPPPAAPAPAAPASNPRQDFGLNAAQREARLPRQQRQLDAITAKVATARPVGAGYWQLAMADGTVWRVEEVRSSFRPPEAGDQVTIVRGALGAFYLKADRQAAVRIRRIS